MVSNRVAIPKEDGAAAGGLAVGILAALQEKGGVWFGWDGKLTENEMSEPAKVTQGDIDFVTVSLTDDDYERYYNGYSNRVLWPACHYLLDFIQYDPGDFDGYLSVNSVFACKLKTILKPNDIIWVHDYHLIPLAAALRSAGVENPIGFFLHVPFPSFEALRAVPGHEYLLRALCAYDVLGFQAPRDLETFKTCVREPMVDATTGPGTTITVAGRSIVADVFPIGVSFKATVQLADAAAGSDAVTGMVNGPAAAKLIIGVDRLDYSKGLKQRMLSYERLLEKNPATKGKVTLMQIAPPTRTGVRAYDDIRTELENTSGRINGRFATTEWIPIRCIYKSISRGPLMGLFRHAHVGLVTPVRDGMNLVAKEYVVAQDPEDPGMLVLSSLAGAACELIDAIVVNPFDGDEVADGIARALNMPLAERRERHAAMLEILRKNDIAAWRRKFVAALRTTA